TTEEEADADFIIYNTCTVRENADVRVFGRLGVLNGYKKKRPSVKIALCGCMMQEDIVVEKIKKSYPFVDLIFGTHNLYKFAELLVTMYETNDRVIDIWQETPEIVEDLPVSRKYSFKSGVNIMFGCNNFCTYCIVPYVRGRERSRAFSEIIKEVESLARDGVKEIMLLGQNVNSYGNDFIKQGQDDAKRFPELLRAVCQVDGIERVRFMSSHPKDLSDELIEVMRTEEKVARHLHLALQSGSDRVLQQMNRHYTKASFLELVNKIRSAIPDMAITTDIIVGFPGETKEDVDDTIEVIEQAKFDNAFTFIYSKRTGTPAAEYEETMTQDEISKQFQRVLAAVQDNARKQAAGNEGETVCVLVEEVNEKDASFLTGRMSNNTLVHFKGNKRLIGEMMDVKLTENKGFYYLGELTFDHATDMMKED
ncbi:MAG: tRNA (N6-isopentenyl adenosine(37)-C2)-methylthiotransferase MiaB, partial [Lachnospiraceae bacterium]|nr:tRNA (N6-isopentenyl adenosine(37)-C2)-methylthiotransferase MiaB [Lachnospiraceae bacterium]